MLLPSLADLRKKLSHTVLYAVAHQTARRRSLRNTTPHTTADIALEPRILLSATDSDPNNTISTAGDFGNLTGTTAPQSLNGSLSSADMVDVYKFTITGNTNVAVHLAGLTQNTILQLYFEGDGNLNLDNYELLESINVNPEASLSEALSAGTYYIRIYNSSATVQNYSLEVAAGSTFGSDAGSNFGTATTLVSGAGALQDVIRTNDTDVYKFTLTAASNIIASIQGIDGTNLSEHVRVQLFRDFSGDGSPNNNDSLETFDYVTGAGLIINEALEAGTYFIWITTPDNNEDYDNTAYQISLNTAEITESTDVGSTFATAATLTSGAAPIKNVVQTNDIDVYKFTLAAPSNIIAVIQGIDGGNLSEYVRVQLFRDFSGDGSPNNNDSLETFDYVTGAGLIINEALEAGTYFIWITSSDDNDGYDNTAYQISLNTTAITGATDVGSTLGTAATLISGATPIKNVVQTNDIDVYKFTLTSASNVIATIQGIDGANISEYIRVQLLRDFNGDGLNNNNDTLELFDYVIGEGLIINEALEAGTYFIWITSPDSNDGYDNTAYQISLNATTIDGATDAGNTFATATTLDAGGTPINNVVQTNDTDVYKFTLATQSDIVATIQGINGGLITEQIRVRLIKDLNNNGEIDAAEEVLRNDYYISGGPYALQENLATGTYFIQINNQDDNGHDNTAYQISLGVLGPEIEIRDSNSVLIDNVSSVNFGSSAQNTQLFSRTFEIRNIGSESFTLQPIAISGSDFELIGQNLPADHVLNPGATFSFTIQMKNNTTGSKTGTVTVTSTDTDEGTFTFNLTGTVVLPPNSAPTNVAISADSIPENRPAGTTVATFNSTDPNAGNTFTYTLVSGTGSTDNAAFSIVGNQLRTAASFNYEAKSSYSIRVRTTDQGGLFFEKTFVISVTDVFELPTGGTALTNLRYGVGGTDSATGIGYMMFSEEDVRTRFSGLDPNNADNFINVRLNGTQWQYDNNATWVNFTPRITDTLVAEINFTTDTVTLLKGNVGTFNGIIHGYLDGDLTITPNQFNGTANLGEFGLSGTYLTFAPRTPLTGLRYGVGGTDNATGTGYMMYSQQNVHTRFSGLDANNALNFINVRYNAGQWQYDNNSTWVNFTPTSTDVLVAALNFTTDTVTLFEGNLGLVNGIVQGYLDGDLNIIANNWAGTANAGEYRVTGTYITFAPRTPLMNLRNGVGGTDNATGTGYMMYSQQNVRTRFSGLDSNNADNFINVRYFAGQWQYDNNSTWVNFVPTSSDRLVAALDFTADTVTLLKGTSSTIQGIASGYLDSDLTITPNNWNGTTNTGEYHLTGTFITFMPTIA